MAMNFGRQWFHADSQVGLTDTALEFEGLVIRGDFLKGIQTCQSQLRTYYWQRRYKQLKRVLENKVNGRTDRLVYFEGMWPDFDDKDNQILDLIKRALPWYNISSTRRADEADISVYSCYQGSWDMSKTEKSLRILFLAENVRPSFSDFDVSLTNDPYPYGGRNVYMPVWSLEVDWFKRGRPYQDREVYAQELVTSEMRAESLSNWAGRYKKAVYIGNNAEPLRMSVIHELRAHGIEVDCFGSQSRPVVDKIGLLRRYRVNICFENSITYGYVTEKPVHAYLAGCLGIYNSNAHETHLITNEATGFINMQQYELSIERLVLKTRTLMEATVPPTRAPLISSEVADRFIDGLIVGLRERIQWI
ncbi:glycosyltransferase family 10 domain-containing protein [Synechococcus sp. BS55D]|uniref:glycosyltransferase family 10 domain-containing protein n=1 Tax=Synechococcus sp. BS55D TaxID=2055943 RepID=UPI00103BC6A4|nr:glycosyltransferase family 10 [Synechococcus sp. BS55D]TCD58086.1 hypothetical protein CWE16_01950 [Synechococcus sp. BS55D]